MIFFEENGRPDIWFFATISQTNNKGVPRPRLIPEQFVPTDDEGMYEKGDDTINVNSNHDLRRKNPIGTIFACLNNQEMPWRSSWNWGTCWPGVSDR